MGRIGRTAASASNAQEMDLYVALPEGIYLYEAAPHRLTPVVAGDFRDQAGRRRRGNAPAQAPAHIIFVVDLAKYAKAPFQEPRLKDPEFQKLYYGVATGLIAGNVYWFAASQGLAAWFHNCNRDALAVTLRLRSDQRVLFAQTVGFPRQRRRTRAAGVAVHARDAHARPGGGSCLHPRRRFGYEWASAVTRALI